MHPTYYDMPLLRQSKVKLFDMAFIFAKDLIVHLVIFCRIVMLGSLPRGIPKVVD
jgi:hypothetical protein